jgi:RimJ/RimL family protein N-acetyltransferase
MLERAPTLETQRLVLTGQTLADFADSAALWANPDVTRFIGGRPFTESESWVRLIRNAGHWAALGFGMWVVRERDSGRYVGEMGFHELRRDTTPSFHGVPEAGWVMNPFAHGKGYATEAMAAIMSWCDETLKAPRTVCIIDPGNVASLGVAHRIGFVEFASTTFNDHPTLILERFNPLQH